MFITTKTYYITYNKKLFVIIKVFKTCYHYLENCKYKVFLLNNYNNYYQIINIKSLSFC